MLDTARLRAASQPYRGSLYRRGPEPVAGRVAGKPALAPAHPGPVRAGPGAAAVAAAVPTVGTVLRRWREARGLSQQDVEALSGDAGHHLGHTTVSAIEHDRPRVPPGSYEAYLRVLLAWERTPDGK